MSEDTNPQSGPDNPANNAGSIFGPPTFSPVTTTVASPAVKDQNSRTSPIRSIFGPPIFPPATTMVGNLAVKDQTSYTGPTRSIFSPPTFPPATTTVSNPAIKDQTPYTNNTRSIFGPPIFPPAATTVVSPTVNDQTPQLSPATTISPNPNIDRTPSPTPSSSSSSSSTPSSPLPNFNAPAVPAIEVPVFTNPFFQLSTLLSSKRRAAIIGQQQRRGTALCDIDDSGTYDPKEERLAQAARSVTRRGGGGKTVRGSDNTVAIKSASAGGTSREKKRKVEEGQRPGLITFTFKSDEGRKYLRTLPAGCSGLRVEEHKELSRRRKRVKTAHNKRSDDLTLDTLTLGHPQYRACKSCFFSGDDECTLIEYSNEYPCAACEDAGVDCELINPPQIKRSCERCKGKRVTCSFKYDGGIGTNVCERCGNTGEKCIAGPSAGGRRMNDVLGLKGKDMERDRETLGKGKGKEMKIFKGNESRKNQVLQTQTRTAIAHQTTSTKKQKPAPRKYVSCNECRDLRTRCSLKPDDCGPCTECKDQFQTCTFTPLKTKSKSSSSQHAILSPVCTDDDRTHAIITDSLRLPDSEWRTTDRTARKRKGHGHAKHKSESKSGIQPTTILTSFSHPIIFNWNPPPVVSTHIPIIPCTWHSNPFFGLWGFGPPRRVEVLPYPALTGAGYEELKHGYGESGEREERSRRCVRCTWERIRILGCGGHRMGKLRGVDERLWEDEWVGRSLGACVKRAREGIEGRPERGSLGALVWDGRWCAVCPSFAEWGCEECALPLCSICNSLHNKVQRGLTSPESGAKSLGRVITIAAAKGTDEYPDGIRADAAFLREDGELMVRFQRGGCELVGGTDGGERGRERGKDELVGLGVDLGGGVVKKGEKREGMKGDGAGCGRGKGLRGRNLASMSTGAKDTESSDSDSNSNSDSDSDSDSEHAKPTQKWKGKGVDRGPPATKQDSNSKATTSWMSNMILSDNEDSGHHHGTKRKQQQQQRKGKSWEVEDGGVIVLLSDDDDE